MTGWRWSSVLAGRRSMRKEIEFYGRVISSVPSSDVYEKLAFDTAAGEFDKIAAERKSSYEKVGRSTFSTPLSILKGNAPCRNYRQ
jgi:hypothetical protein